MKKKMTKTSETVEFEIKFWKDWLYADLLKRLDMVEKLPFVREVGKIGKIRTPEKLREHAIATMLNGLFEDLESAVYTKIELEKKKS